MGDCAGLWGNEVALCTEKRQRINKNNICLDKAGGSPPETDRMLENTLFSLSPVQKLTKRELEILKLIAGGSTNKEIAARLYRTERTIEYHRNRLMHKIGTKRAADLVRRAIALRLIE